MTGDRQGGAVLRRARPSGNGGSGLQSAGTLDRWSADRWDDMFAIRYVGITILAVAAAILYTWWLTPVILIGGGTYNFLLGQDVRHHGRPSNWMAIGDVGWCLLMIGIEPDLTVPAVTVGVACVAMAASAGGRRSSIIGTAFGTCGLVALTTVDRIDDPVIAILSFSICGLLIILAIGTMADSEGELRDQLTQLIDDLDAVLWSRDAATDRFTYVNGRASDLLGFPPEQWTDPGFWSGRVHPDDRDRVLTTTRAAIDAGDDHDLTYRMLTADSRVVHVLDRVTVHRRGGRTTVHGVTLDVTERARFEEQSRQYSDIVEHIDVALVVATPTSRGGSAVLEVVAANPAADHFLRTTADAAPGRSLTSVFPASTPAWVLGALWDVVDRGEVLHLDDVPLARGNVHRSASLRAFRLPGGLLAVSLQDTTDVAVANQALRRQALHDALTGLPNRAHLDERIDAAVPRAAQWDERVALLIMDLDQFKEVNDALGHAVGDRLLLAVADRLRSLIGSSFVARMGGDEFAILMHGPSVDEATARATAELVSVSLSAPFTIDDLRLQTNVSIGIALVPDHAADGEELKRRADVAMYVAKRAGGSHAVYHPDEDGSSVARLTLIGDLREAVGAGQLVLHYQPLLDLADGRIRRVEALIRWQHPEHGLLMPDTFIGLAGLCGASAAIGQWVIREATRTAGEWHAAGHQVGVAVNLSVRNLFDRDLLRTVESAIDTARLPQGGLLVELTESELMDDPSVALAQFRSLQALGVGTSVDDFGTGYSSLTYLRDLPLDEIKIDRSFTAALHRRGGAYTIVRSMIDLGHNLGLEVVAEGVEHADDLPTLAALGCDRVQGYYIARPMPGEAFLPWLEAWTPPQELVGEATPPTPLRPRRDERRRDATTQL